MRPPLNGLEWLERFSVHEAWQLTIDAAEARLVLDHISEPVIDDVVRELEVNGFEVDRVKLANLLRHWARTAPMLTSDVSQTTARAVRDHARRLSPALQRAQSRLEEAPPGFVYHLAQHLDQPLRVHLTRQLWRDLEAILAILIPATGTLAKTALASGRPRHNDVAGSVEMLADIFEFLTGSSPSRTYDPLSDQEVSPFSAFVQRAHRALNGDNAPSLDWAIREVLEDRRKAQAQNHPPR